MSSTYADILGPLTPPTDKKATLIENNSNIPYIDNQGIKTKLEDIPYLQKKEHVTSQIQREITAILQWQNPLRSGLIFTLIIGSIFLTRSYSLLQIISCLLCIATALNLFYVVFILNSHQIVTNQAASHPYSDVISNKSRTTINRDSVNYYANVLVDIFESLIRGLTRIVFVEKTSTSVKWMFAFFAIWKTASVISTMNIILMTVVSAFVLPRLYLSNKDIIDVHVQKIQVVLQDYVAKAQHATNEAISKSYTNSRIFFAKVGTTGTDAKNTLSKTSAVLKEE